MITVDNKHNFLLVNNSNNILQIDERGNSVEISYFNVGKLFFSLAPFFFAEFNFGEVEK